MKPISKHYSWWWGLVAVWDGQGIKCEETGILLSPYGILCVPNRQRHFIPAKPSLPDQWINNVGIIHKRSSILFFYHSSIKHLFHGTTVECCWFTDINTSQELCFHVCIITWLRNTI
jgi:hypothetical protein